MPVSAETAYLFRHALMRDAAYELQPPGERARLHGLTVAVVEAMFGTPPLDARFDTHEHHAIDAYADELAHHARVAASTIPEMHARSLTYLWRGAREAMAGFRLPSALQLLGELESRVPVGELLGVAARFLRGHAELTQGRLAEAESALHPVAVASGDDPEFAAYATRARVDLVHILLRLGRLAEAATLANELRLQTTEQSPALRGHALTALASVRHAQGDLAGAEAAVREGLIVTRGGGKPTQQSDLRGLLATVLRHSGRTAESRVEFELAIEIAASCGAVRVEAFLRTNYASLLHGMGCDSDAEVQYQAALRLARECGDRFVESTVIGNYANMIKADDRLDEAEAGYRQALRVAQETGDRRKQAHWMGSLANIEVAHGRHAKAERQYLAALALAHETSDQFLVGAWNAALALLYVELGRTTEAVNAWRTAEPLLTRFDKPLLVRTREQMAQACRETGVDPALFASA